MKRRRNADMSKRKLNRSIKTISSLLSLFNTILAQFDKEKAKMMAEHAKNVAKIAELNDVNTGIIGHVSYLDTVSAKISNLIEG
jgi:argininosuccinate lyase